MRARFLQPLLAIYAAAPLEIQKKARILWIVNNVIIVSLFASGIVINLLIEFRPRSSSLELGMAGLLVVSLLVLRTGHYTTASTLTILVLLAGMSVAGFLGYSGNPVLDFALLGYNLLPVIFYACLIGYRRYQPLLAMAVSLAANLGYFIFTFALRPAAGNLDAALPMLINSTLLIGISGVMAFFILRTHREVVAIAEAEAESVREKTREVEKAEERLLVTLRSIGDGVITTDIDGRIVLMNRVAEDLTGWSLQEAAGKPLTEVFRIISELTREPCTNPVTRVLASGTIVGLANHTLLIARDGVERIIADSGAPIRDRGNRMIGVVLVFRDITEKQRLERGLQNAARLEALGVLAGGIAHDFNNLLTGLFGYVELAHQAAAGVPEVVATLDKALGVFGRARDLTRQLLTFAKGGKPVKRVTSLAPLLRASAQFVLSGSNIGLVLQLPEDLWPCEIDENQFGQVIDNIVLNARQAMPAGGTVTVRAANVPAGGAVPPLLRTGDYVRISIQDEGGGIVRAYQARIFDPFFTTKPDGSGLGLATAYSIVRQHEGHIEVESEPDQGSVFHIYMPARTAAAAPAKAARMAEWKGQGRILVMDDEAFNRDVLEQMLRLMGFTAACAQEGREAVRMFAAARAAGEPYNAVILDLTVVGGMGGRETLGRLAQIEPNVVAVAASGYSDDPVLSDPRNYGFRASLQKPFNAAELGRVLRDLLAGAGE
jgi:PAS domain S-box-containing protein